MAPAARGLELAVTAALAAAQAGLVPQLILGVQGRLGKVLMGGAPLLAAVRAAAARRKRGQIIYPLQAEKAATARRPQLLEPQ